MRENQPAGQGRGRVDGSQGEETEQRNQLTPGWTGGWERAEPVLLRKEGGVTEMRLAGNLRVN